MPRDRGREGAGGADQGVPEVDLPSVPPELSLLPELQCICGGGADGSWRGAWQLADDTSAAALRALASWRLGPGAATAAADRRQFQHRCRGVAQCSISFTTPCRGSCGYGTRSSASSSVTGPSAA